MKTEQKTIVVMFKRLLILNLMPQYLSNKLGQEQQKTEKSV